jgi:hypothetical protein
MRARGSSEGLVKVLFSLEQGNERTPMGETNRVVLSTSACFGGKAGSLTIRCRP